MNYCGKAELVPTSRSRRPWWQWINWSALAGVSAASGIIGGIFGTLAWLFAGSTAGLAIGGAVWAVSFVLFCTVSAGD